MVSREKRKDGRAKISPNVLGFFYRLWVWSFTIFLEVSPFY